MNPCDATEMCEPFPRAMRRYRPRFRGDIERERGEGLLSCTDAGLMGPSVAHSPEGVLTCAATP
jgi:hypothetical protein